jgi:PhoH-like ATPase
VKTIITRVGDGTKIVLTGDPGQIDNPYVDSTNNGLVHTVQPVQGPEASPATSRCPRASAARSPRLATNLL